MTLSVDGASRTVDADADTVQALSADEHVPVSSRDIVAPGLNAPVKDGEQVVVRYARQLDRHRRRRPGRPTGPPRSPSTTR